MYLPKYKSYKDFVVKSEKEYQICIVISVENIRMNLRNDLFLTA